MRIISGVARGTKLFTLEGLQTRPTLDRVKEALFNIIQNKIPNSQVLDLFAGSGALGIEALSRGAKSAVFCDKWHQAIAIINQNIEKTRLTDKSTVFSCDYKKALEEMKQKGFSFDIIFLDPPYENTYIKKVIDTILDLDLLKTDGIMIVETDKEETKKEIEKTNTNIQDFRKYGRVKLIFLNRKG